MEIYGGGGGVYLCDLTFILLFDLYIYIRTKLHCYSECTAYPVFDLYRSLYKYRRIYTANNDGYYLLLEEFMSSKNRASS